jgi:hypothetical protein
MGNTGAGGQLERVRSREKRGWKRTGVVDSAVVHRSQGLVAAVRGASRECCDGQRNGAQKLLQTGLDSENRTERHEIFVTGLIGRCAGHDPSLMLFAVANCSAPVLIKKQSVGSQLTITWSSKRQLAQVAKNGKTAIITTRTALQHVQKASTSCCVAHTLHVLLVCVLDV